MLVVKEILAKPLLLEDIMVVEIHLIKVHQMVMLAQEQVVEQPILLLHLESYLLTKVIV